MKVARMTVRAVLFLTGTALSGGAALAQGSGVAPGAGDEEIIVTARRVSESIQSVPMAITALTQDTLRAKNITTALDLDKAVPGLTVSTNSGNPSIPKFSIRGRGLNYGAAAGSVETYFADVPLSMPTQAFELPPQFFDIGTFQVLKGPQGTLFGRSTTGGAVVIVPHAVEDIFTGYGRVQGGNYGNVQLEGAVNVPLSDSFGVRLAGFYWKRGGYMRVFDGNTDRLLGTSLNGERFNNQDVLEFRGTFDFHPTDTFKNTLIATFHSDDNRGSAGAGISGNPGTLTFAPSRGYGTLWTDSDVRMRGTQARNKALALVNTTTFELSDAITLKNIFGYIDSDGWTGQPANADGTTRNTISLPGGSPRLVRTKQYTDEFQVQGDLGELTWIAGGLMDLTRQPLGLDNLNLQSATYSGSCVVPAGCNRMRITYGSNKVSSFALFASGTYKFTPELSLTAGFRRTWDKVALYTGQIFLESQVSPNAVIPLPILPTTSLQIFSRHFAGNNYDIGLSYQSTRRTLVYGGFRHGYKRGGFQPSIAPGFDQSFAPERIDDFYAGIKSNFEISTIRVRANLEFYHDIYKGQQASFLTQLLSTQTTNIDKSTYTGLDLDLNADLTDWWTVNANYSYIDAKVKRWTDKSVPGSTVDLTDNPIPYAPEHKLSATTRWHFDTNAGEFAAQGTINYQDKYYSGPTCRTYPLATQRGAAAVLGVPNGGDFDIIANGGCTVPSVTTFDARIELNKVAGTGLSLAANLTNIGNKTYIIGGSNTLLFGAEGYAYGPPRMFTIEATYRF